ncbi:MAG TPA: hypothetical protein VIX84_14805, partial [Acidimicrobiales bacterium]
MSGAAQPRRLVEDPVIMRALEPEVVDVIWQAVEPLLPSQVERHPLGCHRLGCRTGCACGG